MIQFENVTKKYKDNVGLKNFSINIQKGEFIFVVGPSGAGKTTFIKLIQKELEPDQGKIIVNGVDVCKLSNRLIPNHRRNIGMVFQNFRLLNNKTVFDNVAFAMEIVQAPRRKIKRQVPKALELMGIADKAKRYPNELSAGEQQRVAIARAIVNKPEILIADEPTGNLDPVIAWEIMELLEEINAQGTTIVMVTHAKNIVNKMKKRVVLLESGEKMRDDEEGEYALIAQTEHEAEGEQDE